VFELLYQDVGTYPILNRGQKIGEVVVEESDVDELSSLRTMRSNAGDYASVRNAFASYLAKAPDKEMRLDILLKNESDSNELTVNEDGTIQIMGYPMTKDEALEHCDVMPQMKECGPLKESVQKELVSLEGKSMTRGQASQYCALKPATEGCEAFGSLGEANMHTHPEGIEWEDEMLAINQVSSNETAEWIIEDRQTGKRNSEIDWSFAQGDMVKVRIFNDGEGVHPMQHPIHFHGQRFVVLARDGVQNDNLQWKDTVLVPMGKTYDILIDMSNPGFWMAHCHIAEHMQSGMMFNFRVE
jgi:FtsP/CotA-like multicopper oxidase with cupredoxin domain